MWNCLRVAVDPVCTDTAKCYPAVTQKIVNLFPSVLFVVAKKFNERIIPVYSPEIVAFDTLVYILSATHRCLVTVHIEGITLVIQKC